MAKFNRNDAFNSRIGLKNQTHANPVEEIKSYVRNYSNSQDGDEDAPFNFRAMLKKTNYQINDRNDEYDYNKRNEYSDENQNSFRSINILER
uniref:Uncharacterized protein n=1 Tax=Megaselia scalaris TaxID=36166 RepID=T1GWZ0_MEGSC